MFNRVFSRPRPLPYDSWDIRFGGISDPEELIKRFERHDPEREVPFQQKNLVAPYVLDRIRNGTFVPSPAGTQQIVGTTLKRLGFKGELLPWQAVELAAATYGLRPCPEDTAIWMSEQVGLATNYRHIFLGVVNYLVTHVDLESYCLGLYGARRKLLPDDYIFLCGPQ